MVQSLFDLETAIEIRHVHKGFIKLPTSLLFGTTCYKVFGLKFSLYLEGYRRFRLYIAKARDKIKTKESCFMPSAKNVINYFEDFTIYGTQETVEYEDDF